MEKISVGPCGLDVCVDCIFDDKKKQVRRYRFSCKRGTRKDVAISMAAMRQLVVGLDMLLQYHAETMCEECREEK